MSRCEGAITEVDAEFIPKGRVKSRCHYWEPTRAPRQYAVNSGQPPLGSAHRPERCQDTRIIDLWMSSLVYKSRIFRETGRGGRHGGRGRVRKPTDSPTGVEAAQRGYYLCGR